MMEFQTQKFFQTFLCFIALLIVMWGATDSLSAIFNGAAFMMNGHAKQGPGVSSQDSPGAPENIDPPNYGIYQQQFLFDRLFDGLARVAVGAGVYLYFTKKRGVEL